MENVVCVDSLRPSWRLMIDEMGEKGGLGIREVVLGSNLAGLGFYICVLARNILLSFVLSMKKTVKPGTSIRTFGLRYRTSRIHDTSKKILLMREQRTRNHDIAVTISQANEEFPPKNKARLQPTAAHDRDDFPLRWHEMNTSLRS